MQITKHFSKTEMEFSATGTRHGLNNQCPDELIPNMLKVAIQLELIREHFGKPIIVLSCYRSPEVNKAVGGSPTSAHRYAMAADIQIDGVSPQEVCKWIAENLNGFDQVICEFNSWTHIGFTNKIARGEILTAVKQNGKTVYNQGIA